MDNTRNKEFDLYKDIQNRTGGEIYIGVVGPVRTGKSTFLLIRRRQTAHCMGYRKYIPYTYQAKPGTLRYIPADESPW